MALAAGGGQGDEDAAAVVVAEAAFDQAAAGQAVDEAGQGALAEVDGVGQFLGAEFVVGALGQAVEDLELADAELVPSA